MPRMIEVIIPDDPIPKLRPKFRRNGFAYDPQHQLKESIQWKILEILRHQYPKVIFPLKGPVNVEMSFFLSIPESWSKKDKNLLSWHFDDHTSKPDIDNLLKFYLDCMTQIVYED